MEAVAVTGLLPVLTLIPFWLVALGLVWLLMRPWVDLPFWWLPVGWVALGLGMFVRPLQVALLTPLLGARRPTPAEAEALRPVWVELTRILDLPTDRYVLRVLPAEELNAYASGGHLVVVTSYAIEHLDDRSLAGVLAHELSHHLGLHTVALTLGHWLSIPIMAWAKIGFFLRNVAHAATDTFATRSTVLTTLGDVFAALLNTAAWVFLAGLHLSDAATNHFSRTAEFEADRRVVVMGYGPHLSAALSTVAARVGEIPADDLADSGTIARIDRRLASSHPPARTRLARIHAMLRGDGLEGNDPSPHRAAG